MSETPDDWAGAQTERIMMVWYRKLDLAREPRPNTRAYNAAYEAVYEILREQERIGAIEVRT